eukprot:scaffold580456_cov48-Prasinocladus_malaysianus.AAC.1
MASIPTGLDPLPIGRPPDCTATYYVALRLTEKVFVRGVSQYSNLKSNRGRLWLYSIAEFPETFSA